jgi:regulator of protease activity HflC (stomatin/prohibitin superfamily)
MASAFRPPSGSASPLLKRLILAAVLIVGSMLALSSCATRIDAAHVGIRVKLAGSSRGVDDIPTVSGWVFYNPLTEQIIQFPTTVQNVIWSKDAHEGRPHDESITFSSLEGANINADIGLSFHIEREKAPHLYLRFRTNNLNELANGYVRNSVREAFNVITSKMPVESIYGAGKATLESDVRRRVQEHLGKDGFVLDQLAISSALRLPENVATSINRTIEAKQLVTQAENRVRQVKAEAEQAITQATGQATAAMERAKGEAQAKIITAKAEARANMIMRRSMSPTVLQYRALERWNGKLPVMNGGGGQLPMLTFDLSKVEKFDDKDEKFMKELMAEDEEEAKKEEKRDAKKEEAKKEEAKKEEAKKEEAKKEEARGEAPKK